MVFSPWLLYADTYEDQPASRYSKACLRACEVGLELHEVTAVNLAHLDYTVAKNDQVSGNHIHLINRTKTLPVHSLQQPHT